MTAKLLIAGNIAKDVTADGWRPGGGAFYAAAQAYKLGAEVTVFTACSGDIEPATLLPQVDWRVQPSDSSTTFENKYKDGHRSQRLLSKGAPIALELLPEIDVILLTPVFHEIAPDSVASLAASGAVLGVSAQGWLRELDGERVRPTKFETDPPWLRGDVVFLSEEDIQDTGAVGSWRARVPIVALTRGRDGCTVWDSEGRHDVSTASVRELDPTGAGDIFAAAFLLHFYEARDVLSSARFAAAAAALSVRGEGIGALAGRDEIEALLSTVKVA